MPGFKGFGPKALPFLKALKFHQNKVWFDENKALYESDIVAPMVALLDDLSATFAKAGIALKANGKRSIFRIHRDVRFAKDKSPYKTHSGAVMTRSGSKNENGLLYIHIGPDGCFAAAGFHIPEPSGLALIRKEIAVRPKQFHAMEAKLAAGKLKLGTENQLSRLPRGFEALKDGPLDGAVRLKSFIVEESLPAKLITRPGLAETIVDFTHRAEPLLAFGWKALGKV
ncbi:MAG TPA: TIGR02453 family protein [Bauldia sp.]